MDALSLGARRKINVQLFDGWPCIGGVRAAGEKRRGLPRISFHSIRATLPECGWRASAVLSAPTSRTGVFIFRSTMSNSDAPSRHHRKPGNDDAELHSRDAIRIGVFFHTSRKLASNGREAMSLLPKEGGGAPNGAPTVAAPRCAGAAAAR